MKIVSCFVLVPWFFQNATKQAPLKPAFNKSVDLSWARIEPFLFP